MITSRTSIVPKVALIVSRRSGEYSSQQQSAEAARLQNFRRHLEATLSLHPAPRAIQELRRSSCDGGKFLEQFDFFLFGFYATQIAGVFFPAGSEFASLMMTFALFGAGFLMRPHGAVILGAYIDDVGRRKGDGSPTAS
ncbi:hypothetical protein OKW41_004482 [Paraburkholderia sp. UCT70]